MTVKSNALPMQRVDINTRGTKTTVTLWDGTHIESTDPEGNVIYTYEIYQKVLRARKDFENIILGNFNTWYDKIKAEEYENHAAAARDKRNELLSATDWTQTLDAPLPIDKIEQMQVYRQELRDITGQEGFPYDIVWPVPEV